MSIEVQLYEKEIQPKSKLNEMNYLNYLNNDNVSPKTWISSSINLSHKSQHRNFIENKVVFMGNLWQLRLDYMSNNGNKTRPNWKIMFKKEMKKWLKEINNMII